MRFVFADAGGSQDLEAYFESAEPVVGDLISALAGAGLAKGDEGGLFVDGIFRYAEDDLADSGGHDAAVVSFAMPAPSARRQPIEPGLYLQVLSGGDAGRIHPLLPGSTYVIGRGEECDVRLADLTVSKQHCKLDVSETGQVIVTNLSTTYETRIEGTSVDSPTFVAEHLPVRLGSVRVVVAKRAVDDRPAILSRPDAMAANGTFPVNRPPRVGKAERERILVKPSEPRESDRQPFSLVAVVAPLGLAVVMVVALKNALYAMFAILSPVMAVGNWWESKRRSSKSLRRSTREFSRELTRFESALEQEGKDEAAALRAEVPTVPEVLRRAGLPSVTIWERRKQHPDFLHLYLGACDLVWQPKFAQATGASGAPSEQVEKVIEAHRILSDVPAVLDLSQGRVVGIVGARAGAIAVARSLICQAAALHGPADLRIAVATPDESGRDWDWAKWLPHVRDHSSGSERRLLAAGSSAVQDLLSDLLAAAPDKAERPSFGFDQAVDERATTMFVIDGDEILHGRTSPARRLLAGAAGPATGVVIAPSADRLPAVCSDIVILQDNGEAELIRPWQGGATSTISPAELDERLALGCTRALSQLDDPEMNIPGAALPEVVRLGTILGGNGRDSWDGEAILARWRQHADSGTLAAEIGAAEGGPFVLDLDRHGPHGLVGGTTGSGKSELLKTLVAALAANYPPTELTFGLFDFKGGATFAEFAALPHTVGLANDLDVSLAKRALRCLRAELLHRERVFDQAGVKDLAELNERRAMGDSLALQAEALPRLLVIIDEFATMSKELADEIGTIADLTARGRSLGVHLLLATQKPSTAINSEVRTNTRLRISLQVEDRQDSIDVVGKPDAAEINHKGRGYFRVGQGEVVPIQTAWSSGPPVAGHARPARVAPFYFGVTGAEDTRPPQSGRTELQALLEGITKAFELTGAPLPRQPWPPPLPDNISLGELAEVPLDEARPADDVYFALADDPDRQLRFPVGWRLRSGNLLLYGVVGSGTTTALSSIALSFVRGGLPTARHLYVLDAGAGDLAPLSVLPHCAAVVKGTERDRQIPLLSTLTRELTRRRAATAGKTGNDPVLLFVIDNLEGVRLSFEEDQAGAHWDEVVRIWNEGPEVGIHTVASVTRFGGIPASISSTTPNKLMFRLADVADYGNVGIPRASLPKFAPGRAIFSEQHRVVQVAVPDLGLAAAVKKTALDAPTPPGAGPRKIDVLRSAIPAAELAGVSRIAEDRWELALGEREADSAPATLVLYEGEHALVAGPARSGKSTALVTIGASLRDCVPHARIVGYASRRSPLRSSPLLDEVATSADELSALAASVLVKATPTLLLVDDLEMLGADDAGMTPVLSAPHPHVHVVAAGKADVVRTMFGHWNQVLRRSRAGLLLQPALDRDGELLGVRLPYRVHIAMPPGRGFLVCNGEVDMVQTAMSGSDLAP